MPTATDLLQSLRDVSLLEDSQVEAVSAEFSLATDPDGVAEELIRRGFLTPFQAQRLLLGEGNLLFIGPYLLLDILGEGGMGRVYKALHRRLNRLVALKTIREECLSKDSDAASRFDREARAAASLNHPNIVTLYDFDQANGVQFLAMEYVHGPELGRLVKRHGPLGIEEAVDCIRQAALGLQHAHEQGMVHRDLKPSNLLAMDPHGARRTGRHHLRNLQRPSPEDPGSDDDRLPDGAVIKILDMGLVRMIDPKGERQSTLTQEGELFGTPDYIAPEQARDARKADIRSDLYSLGCTLYFLLTGRAPFKGDSVLDVLMAHQLDTATPVEELRPEVPEAIGNVVRKLMAKKPDSRFQTPIELVKELAGPRGPSTPARVMPGALADILLPVTGLTPSISDKTPLPQALANEAEAAKKIGEYRGHNGAVQALHFAADRRQLASGSADGSVRLWGMSRQTNDKETLPIPTRAGVQAVEFSPDRRLLAAAADAKAGTIWLWDRCAAISKPTVSLHGHSAPIECLAFGPAGKLLASAGKDCTVRIWEVDTARPREICLLEGHAQPIQAIAFSPDARLLVSAAADGILRVWGLGKLWYEARSALECHEGRILTVRFSSDGRAMATGGADRSVKLWDVRAGLPQREPLHVLTGHNAEVRCLHFSPDDRHVISVDADGLVILWEVSSGRRVFEWRVRLHKPACSHAFTHDARYLATGLDDGSVVVHRIPFREMNL